MKLSKLKEYQQSIILTLGYLLVLGIGFGLGQIWSPPPKLPEIRVEEVFSPPNDTEKLSTTQSQQVTENGSKQALAIISFDGECNGKIKGNIGSGNDRVYHLPNGSFYKRVVAEVCFNSEKEAVTAGFRKSAR